VVEEGQSHPGTRQGGKQRPCRLIRLLPIQDRDRAVLDTVLVGAVEQRQGEELLALAGGGDDRGGVRHREQRTGGQRHRGVLRHGVVHLARAAAPLQAGVAVGLRGDRGIRQLLHVEAQLQPVLGFPGGVVGNHVDVLAVAVGHRHVEALTDGPAVAGVDHLVTHGAGGGDDVALAAVIQRQLVQRVMGGERRRCRDWRRQPGRLDRQGGGIPGEQGENNCQGGRKAHEVSPRRGVVPRA